MLPNIYNENLARRQREQCTLALEILVFATLATISSFHVHNQYVVSHAFRGFVFRFSLVLRHPYSFCCLPPLLLGHDSKVRAEEMIEERRLAGRLRAEDGDQVVIEASRDQLFYTHIGLELRTARSDGFPTLAFPTTCQKRRAIEQQHLLEFLVLVDDLDAMFILLAACRFANRREMPIHHNRGCRGTLLKRRPPPVDLQVRRGRHGGEWKYQ
jgi:hypothetical protein